MIFSACLALAACGGGSPQQTETTPPSNETADLKESTPAAPEVKPFTVEVVGFENGAGIPERYAFCKASADGKSQSGDNHSPEVRWHNPPAGTQSFAIVMMDPEVPGDAKLANKKGKTLKADMERTTFYHWVAKDIPSAATSIPEGGASAGITAKGKPVGKTAYGVTGVNDFSAWFKTDKKMAGQYGGYDGPCPPWNDEMVHHYHFKIFALDVPTLDLPEAFDGRQLEAAIQGHSLGEAHWVGTYTLNPTLAKPTATEPTGPATTGPAPTE